MPPGAIDRPGFSDTLPASFSGLLPCADCAGIRHVIEFYPDHTVVHRMSYLGKGEGGSDARFDSLGRWDLAADGRRLTVGSGGEEAMILEVQGPDSLEVLDRLGQPIRSTANHMLTRDPTFQPGEPIPLPTAALRLERTRWRLLESKLAVDVPDAVRDRVRLDFTADRLSANSGCNTGNAGYRVDLDGTLQLPGAMATTRMACMGEVAAYETAFFNFLTSAPVLSREANSDELILRGTAGEPELLRFGSMPVPSEAARQKFIYVAADKAPCTGVALRECLQVRESPEAPWQLFYSEIIGFRHEPGTEYRLRILEDDVPNPPADGSSRRWFLDLVVARKSVR